MTFDDFKSKRIKLYRNGDVFQLGRKMIVSSKSFRNFEQFLHHVSVELSLTTGAARRIYSMDGRIVRKLDDLEDNGLYVATSGEAYKKVPYPITDAAEALVANKNKTTEMNYRLPLATDKFLSYHPANSDDSEEEPIFGPTSKAYIVFVYPNGDSRVPGVRFLLNYRTCRTFHQLLKSLSNVVYQTGGVKRVYDIDTGKRVQRLSELKDGQNLACASSDAFKQCPYPLITPVENAQTKKEPEMRKVVTFYPNGDSYHTGYIVPVLKTRFPTLQKLIDHLNSQFRLVAGPVKQIYAINGKKMKHVDHFENGEGYVLVSGSDPFIQVAYNVNSDEVSNRRQGEAKGLGGATTKNELMSMIRPAAEPDYSKMIKAQEEAMQMKLNRQMSHVRSYSQTSQSQTDDAASIRSVKRTKSKKKKSVTKQRIPESDAENDDEDEEAQRALQRKASKKQQQQQPVAAEKKKVSVVVPPKKSKKQEVESEVEQPKENKKAKAVANDKQTRFESEKVKQFNKANPQSEVETSAAEQTEDAVSSEEEPQKPIAKKSNSNSKKDVVAAAKSSNSLKAAGSKKKIPEPVETETEQQGGSTSAQEESEEEESSEEEAPPPPKKKSSTNIKSQSSSQTKLVKSSQPSLIPKKSQPNSRNSSQPNLAR